MRVEPARVEDSRSTRLRVPHQVGCPLLRVEGSRLRLCLSEVGILHQAILLLDEATSSLDAASEHLVSLSVCLSHTLLPPYPFSRLPHEISWVWVYYIDTVWESMSLALPWYIHTYIISWFINTWSMHSPVLYIHAQTPEWVHRSSWSIISRRLTKPSLLRHFRTRNGRSCVFDLPGSRSYEAQVWWCPGAFRSASLLTEPGGGGGKHTRARTHEHARTEHGGQAGAAGSERGDAGAVHDLHRT